MDMAKHISDITDRTEEFGDFESNKVKVVILDGETGKVSLVEMPFHGDVIIKMIKGAAVKVRYENDYLL